MGVRYDAGDVRTAIDDAARGRVGTLTDRIALLCAHLDPRTGLHTAGAMLLARLAGLVALAGLAVFAWRHREAR
jgi:protein SCO1/2